MAPGAVLTLFSVSSRATTAASLLFQLLVEFCDASGSIFKIAPASATRTWCARTMVVGSLEVVDLLFLDNCMSSIVYMFSFEISEGLCGVLSLFLV